MTTVTTPEVSLPTQKASIAIIGNPNCGKTTLFNALTGLRQRVGNYPGVTVEKREGAMSGRSGVRLLDLPGAYSLVPHSPDEAVGRDVLLGRMKDTPKPDAVLVVVDATNLERNLYLATQVIELGLPVVIACNMMDGLRESGQELDTEQLTRRLGVPVVPTVGANLEGIEELRLALKDIVGSIERIAVSRAWTGPESIETEINTLADRLNELGIVEGQAARGLAILLLAEDEAAQQESLPRPIIEHLSAARRRLVDDQGLDPSLELTRARYVWLEDVVGECLRRTDDRELSATWTDRLDKVLTHRIGGLAIFAPMMALLFYSIFVLADPLMGMIETGVTWSQETFGSILPAGPLRDLITDGVIAGVGNVIVFFPQICILFLFIAVLEDSGYMSRAAFLTNRIMSKVGLHGKSFIPLLSSHACAVPAIMATRTIENPRDRLVTILVAPLMGCSARLPVYTVLIAACLPGAAWIKAVLLISMYALGVLAALFMAWVFKNTFLRGPAPAFIIELPPYRMPRVANVIREMWSRSQVFLVEAGTIILAMTIVLWALMNYPKSDTIAQQYEAQRTQLQEAAPTDAEEQLAAIDQAESSAQLANSFAGRLGQTIEPVIEPLGYDWRIGIGVLASFAAREVFVGTMGVVFSVGEADEESKPLRTQFQEATWPDGRKLFTPLVAFSLMIFYVLACQCASTLAVTKRETNSWRWPIFMLVYMSALAYVAALLVYQVGSALNIGTA
jgi:ferrous iron transport protein B